MKTKLDPISSWRMGKSWCWITKLAPAKAGGSGSKTRKNPKTWLTFFDFRFKNELFTFSNA